MDLKNYVQSAIHFMKITELVIYNSISHDNIQENSRVGGEKIHQ